MKIIFAGTPETAVPALQALIGSEHTVVAVLTRQDAPVGRKKIMTPSPVAVCAEAAGIPVIKANRVDDSVVRELSALEAQLGVVVAYGGLLPQTALDALEFGWINLHFSKLPLWRGAAPVQRQLMVGARTISTDVFQLVAQLDAGDVLSSVEHAIRGFDTSASLLQRLADRSSAQLVSVVDAIALGAAVPVPQAGEATFAPKLSRADGLLDAGQTAQDLYNRFRGVTPEPGAWVSFRGETLKIHDMKLLDVHVPGELGDIVLREGGVVLVTTDGSIELLSVQPAGKNHMKATDWFRGITSPETARVDDIA